MVEEHECDLAREDTVKCSAVELVGEAPLLELALFFAFDLTLASQLSMSRLNPLSPAPPQG